MKSLPLVGVLACDCRSKRSSRPFKKAFKRSAQRLRKQRLNYEKGETGMKRYVLAISVILCTLMLGMAIAQEKAKEQQKPDKPPMPTTITQTGEVLSVDTTKNEIVIKDDTGAEIHFLIGTSTKITREGKAISLGDVKAGDKVTGECEQSADGCKAKSIVVTPAAPSQ